jgi:hypothetical protein
MELMAYHEHIMPLGERRSDIHAALIAATIANSNRDPKREAFTLDDFLLKPKMSAPAAIQRQTAEEQFAIFEAIRIQQNAQWEKAHA